MNNENFTVIETFNTTVFSRLERVQLKNKKIKILKTIKTSDLTPGEISQIHSSLKHRQNIQINEFSAIQDIINLDEEIHVIIEDFEGIRLSDLQKFAEISLKSALYIVHKITEIITALHNSNIILYNLNPCNILVDQKTLNVRIIDSCLLPEMSSLQKINHTHESAEKRLPYISPEMTGLLRRSVDPRTDLYSAGIIFYQLITHNLPFPYDEVGEILNAQLKEKPLAPVEYHNGIPPVVSDMILKALEKEPEKRYQSAAGLKHDLKKCIDDLDSRGEIASFTICERDIPERFMPSQRLYGREPQLNRLKNIFKEISNGKKSIITLHGPSGIGKTAVVINLFKPLIENRCYFISGKCEQLSSRTPYRAIIQAFQGLIRQILTESSDGIQIWKESIVESLGQNSRIIIDVIPEVEKIIGPQPKAPELGPEESLNRFNMVFINFVRIFTNTNRPLVIFIDDLQWADTATLTLMKLLIYDIKIQNTLMIGSYRSNEVSKYHSLSIIKNQMQSAGVKIEEIQISPLTIKETEQMLSDTFICDISRTESLAGFACSHTEGNPLYLSHFLNSLNDKHLINLDPEKGWTWNFEKIQNEYKTDRAETLADDKFSLLPDNEQTLLRYASCIGSNFNIEILSTLVESPADKLFPSIRKLIREGYITPTIEGFRFVHDKIYESAYQSIPDDGKQKIHYKTGNILLNLYNDAELSENIFSILNHFAVAHSIIDEPDKKIYLSELNLRAGKKAMLSAAYELAATYFTTGIDLLPDNSWQNNYSLSLELYRENFQCQYINDNMETAYGIFLEIKDKSRSVIEIADLYNINTDLLMISSRSAMAIDFGIEGLSLLDVNLKKKPSWISLNFGLLKLKSKLKKMSDAAIMDLPVMSDKKNLMAMSLLLNMWMPAYSRNHKLLQSITIEMVKESLLNGNCDISSFGYMAYNILPVDIIKKSVSHKNMGELSLKLNGKFKNPSLNCKLDFLYGAFHIHWTEHARKSIEHLTMAYKTGTECGDIHYSSLAGLFKSATMSIIGLPLDEVRKTALKHLDYSRKGKYYHVSNSITIVIKSINQLMGKSKSTMSMDDDNFNEKDFVDLLKKREVIQPRHWYNIFKARNLYLFGKYSHALTFMTDDTKLVEWHSSSITIPEHHFIKCLCVAAVYQEAAVSEKRIYRKLLRKSRKLMKKWAEGCPENYLHKYILIEAEIQRIKNNDKKAMLLYSRAIESATENGYIQNASIASELAGKFYLKTGLTDIAKKYINDSIRGFSGWGAKAKTDIMYKEYASLVKNENPETAQTPARTTESKNIITSFPESAMNAIKKIQRISKKNLLIQTIISSLSEISCSDRCFMILKTNGHLQIEAVSLTENSPQNHTLPVPVSDSEMLAFSAVKHAARTGHFLNINYPSKHESFQNDPYIQKNMPSAILCCPLVTGNIDNGLIYLEKDSKKNPFTDEETDLIRIISLQAAVSLSNALEINENTSEKNEKSALKNIDTDEIMNRIKKLVEEDKIYTMEDLTLTITAGALCITRHQLSEFLNEKMNVNFNTFINRYRIDEAKKMLLNEPDQSVISIAYSVGFNSVSPFYSAFLKFTDMSPAKFRKESFKKNCNCSDVLVNSDK